MAMVVRSNMNAMNANRNLSINNGQVAKSLEKLASGYAINRAGDDASGLAISEKMKAQIKGLEQASDNSQDGISLIQTAEGGMNEIHDMLNRMVELATKSANGTIQNEVDRDAIQSEVNALRAEIDRISDATNFNGIDLLNGNLDSGSAGASSATTNTVSYTGTSAATAASNSTNASLGTIAGTPVTGETAKMTVKFSDINGDEQELELEYTVGSSDDAASVMAGLIAAFNGSDAAGDNGMSMASTGVITNTNNDVRLGEVTLHSDAGMTSATQGEAAGYTAAGSNVTVAHGQTLTVNDQEYIFVVAASTDLDTNGAVNSDGQIVVAGTDAEEARNNLLVMLEEQGVASSATTTAAVLTINTSNVTAPSTGGGTGKALTLQVGDTYKDFNMVSVNIQSMKCDSIGVDGISVSDQESSGAAIDVIKEAINMVSTNRANLGALQNRLEYTINNLDNTSENMTSANSTIRDTDMASEMMEYTKMNVLVQSAQSMLAQANQAPQQVLSLLG